MNLEKQTGSYHEHLLLLQCLEATMTKLGSGVDKLEVNLLQSTTAGLHQQRLQTRIQRLDIF